MLELNETMLEAVSGGWGFRSTRKTGKIEITNKNHADVDVKSNRLYGKNSGISVLVAQGIEMGNTSNF